MSSLKLHLFGTPRLLQGDEVVNLRPRKALALFTYLAVTGQPHGRDALATMLWPESDQTSARGSLRRTLHRLQQSLPPGIVDATTDTIQISHNADLWVDVQVFQALVTESGPAQISPDEPPTQRVQPLIEAAALYVDSFLAGFTLDDAPTFDDWQFFQQESLRRDAARVFDELQQIFTEYGDYEAAIDYARLLLALDTLHEPAHRRLMQLYYWANQHAAAIRQYQECTRILAEELDVPPAEETSELYEAIRTKRLPVPTPSDLPGLGPTSVQQYAKPGMPAPPGHTGNAPVVGAALPLPSTPFVGRATELAQINELLTQERQCRLLVLVGPSGIGKSRLALQIALHIQDQLEATPFTHGVVLLNLEAATEPNDIVGQFAAAVGLSQSGAVITQEQVTDYLCDKRLLLVIDHLELLQDESQILHDWLRAAPHLKILATSRIGVHRQEAWLYPIGSLSYPTSVPEEADTPLRYDAVRLFDERARRFRPTFSLEAEAPHVMRICQMVEGMPLAVELAATWLTVLSTQHIADEISRGLDILMARDDNVPQRHRSMRAVLDQSWSLLSSEERLVFARFAVFRDGFTAAAARAVADADTIQLADFVDKSLLRLNDDGRYTIHELLRQYAEERLSSESEEENCARASHAEFYLNFLSHCSTEIKTPRQRTVLAEVQPDIANILRAWAWIIDQGDYTQAISATISFWLVSHYLGNLSEGEQALDSVVRKLRAQADGDNVDHALLRLLGVLTAGQGWLKARRGDADTGRPLMEQGIHLLHANGAQETTTFAFVQAYQAMAAQYQSRNQEARAIAQKSLDIYTKLDDKWGIAMALEVLGTSVMGYGHYVEARQILHAALTAAQVCGDQRLVLLCMTFLGIIAVNQGNVDDADELLNQALKLAEELGSALAIATTLTYLGNLALNRGNLEMAEEYLQRSKATERQTGVTYDRITSDLLSATYRVQGKLDLAERIAREALQQAQAKHVPRRTATSLSILGQLAYDRGDYRNAEELQRQALAFSREIGHAPGEAAALCLLGHIAVARRQHSDAQRLFADALRITRQHILAPIALECMVGAIEISLHAGDKAYAARIYEFVLHHPSTMFDTRQRARAVAQKWTGTLQEPESIEHSRLWHATDWIALAEEIESRLDAPQKVQPKTRTRNLPADATPFVGREQEIKGITENLLNPACRLLTIIGLGGIGKTRLALHVARHLPEETDNGDTVYFRDGIVFISLNSVADVSELVGTISEAAGISIKGTAYHHQPLLESLADKSLLLILDNFEETDQGSALIGDILSSAPEVKILLTSRATISVPDAWFYPVGGMSFPRSTTYHAALQEFESVRLFAQSAQRARPDFNLEQDIGSVAEICRLVEGMPLALELVATWLKVLPIEAIVQEINRDAEILTARYGNVPQRHRSMRAVIEQSWAMLSNDEQHVFMALAIFRGGFRRKAAQVVAGATLSALVALVEKSLLTLSENGRYSMHELLRQFALEKMAAEPHFDESVRTQFSNYYLDFLESRMDTVAGPQQQAILSEIAEEIDNVQVVWQWALEHNNLAWLERAVYPYRHYLWVRDRGQSGLDVFRHALRTVQQSEDARRHPRYAALQQRLWEALGAFSYFVGDLAGSITYLEQAIAEARKLGNQRHWSTSLTTLGTVYIWLGRPEKGAELLQSALGMFHEAGDVNGIANAVHELARVSMFLGDYQSARERSETSLFYSRQLARSDWIGYATLTAGAADTFLGNYAAAERSIEDGLTAFSSIGHHLGMALSWGALSWLYWSIAGGPTPQAESFGQRSLETIRRIGHRLQTSHRLAQLAQYANDAGDHELAIRYSDEGAAIAEAIQSPLFLSQNLAYRAEAAYRTGDFAAARALLGKACTVAHDAQLHSRVLLVLYCTAELYYHEAEDIRLSVTDRQASRDAALQFYRLTYSHPATWHAYRQRIAMRLTQKDQGTASTDSLPAHHDAQLLADEVAAATERIMSWATKPPHIPLATA